MLRDTSQDLDPGSDKRDSMLHLATGIRQKCDLKCVPSRFVEREHLLWHKNQQKCHLLDPFREPYLRAVDDKNLSLCFITTIRGRLAAP